MHATQELNGLYTIAQISNELRRTYGQTVYALVKYQIDVYKLGNTRIITTTEYERLKHCLESED